MTDCEANCDISSIRLEDPEIMDQTMPLQFIDSLTEELELMNTGEREIAHQCTSDNEFAEEDLEIECPRGVADDGHFGMSLGPMDEEDSAPLIDAAKMKKDEMKELGEDEMKIRQIRAFIKGIRTDAKWATECPEIRIAMCHELKGEITNAISYMAEHYNARPKSVTFTTKFWSLEDILGFVEAAFAGSEKPLLRSRMFIICKNPTESLLDLAKPLLAKVNSIGVRAEFGPIYAEKVFKAERKRVRFSTKDLKSYMMYETQARNLGLNMITTFRLTKKDVNDKDFSIQWYDTVHSNNERYTVVHLNYLLYPDGMLFRPDGPPDIEFSFDADDEGVVLLPVSCALPPVGDLIQYILANQVEKSKI